MKMLKFTYLIVFCLATIICQAQIRDRVDIQLMDIQLTKTQEFERINWQSAYTTSEEGKPELPVYRVSYVLPIDAKVTGVTFQSQKKQLFKQDVYIYPAQPPVPVGYAEDIAFIRPDKRIYESDTPYPGKLYDIESDVIMHGYHVVTLCIYPFEYIPQSRILNYYPEMEYTLEYESGTNTNIIRPATQSVLRADLAKTFIKHWVKNVSDVEKFGSTARSLSDGRTIVQQNSSGLRSQELSVLDEIVPDYIIITCDSLKPAFQPLVDWKTKKGIFTVCVTTEEINANYTGSDLPEKIRNYLLGAHAKWGDNLFILLGGDINIVPSRMVMGSSSLQYPADKYYSISDDWKPNSNHVFFGSNSNSYVNFLGRVLVSNTQEVSTIISKIIAYEKADNLGNLNYLKNNLYADAYLEYQSDSNPNGALTDFHHSKIKNIYVSPYTSGIINKYICDNADCSGSTSRYSLNNSECYNGSFNQGNIELNRANFLSCLNTGANLVPGKFHFIYHIDHSNPVSMATSSKDKGQSVNRTDMDNLTNGPSWQILFSGGCKPANFQYDCMAKHYLMNPSGGGVVFIGNTDNGYQYDIPQLADFLQSLYTMKRYDIANAFQKAALYNRNWRLHLLGDPEMQVWTNIPQTLNASITSPAVVTTGQQNLSISVSGLAAGDTARICIWKDTEVYEVRDKIINGTHTFTVTPHTTGTMKVTVTAHNFVPCEKSIVVVTGPYSLYVSDITLIDDGTDGSIGNGNGKMDAGETIALDISLTNSGSATATNVEALLAIPTYEFVTLTGMTSYGTIAPGQTKTSSTRFLFHVDSSAEEWLNPVRFFLNINDGNGRFYSDDFTVDLFASQIGQGNKTIVTTNNGDKIIDPGETVQIKIDLRNTGRGDATGLTGVLSSNNCPYIVSCDATPVSFPTIGKNVTKTSDGIFQFTVSNAYTDPTLPLDFTLLVQNEFGRTWSFNFNLTKPDIIKGLEFTATETTISLKWNSVPSAGGYNVYRCNVGVNDTESGSYEKLNPEPLAFSFFSDDGGLGQLTKYYYKITTVSPSGMESDSVRILAWTSYSQKYLFPVTVNPTIGKQMSVNVADVNFDGKKEIFTVAKSGWIEGLDCEGQELYDIDNNPTTVSGFADMGIRSWAPVALADIKRNGEYNVIAATRSESSNDKLFCFSMEDKNGDGKPDLLWSQTLSNETHRGVVVSNLDNSADGSMEIVVLPIAQSDHPIRIYDADGTLLRTLSPGLSSYYYAYGALAVADLDGDGDMEIILACDDGIYVWHHDGKNFIPNQQPIYTVPNGYKFRSSVVICDIDGDGNKDILTCATTVTSPPYKGMIFAIKTDTILLKTNNALINGWGTTQTIPHSNNFYYIDISVGDLDNDGALEVVACGGDSLKIWKNTGVLKTAIKLPESASSGACAPILADVDGDPDIEVVMALSNSKNIYAYKHDGSRVLGFPIQAADIPVDNLCIEDVDNDGFNELISVNSDKIQMWRTDGLASRIEWGRDRHNQFNTGEYHKICNPMLISSNTTWSSTQAICGEIIVKSGTLTINNNCNVSMDNSSMILVMSGATLQVDGGNLLNSNVKVLQGGHLIIENNGTIQIRRNGEFNVTLGATFDLLYGSVEYE